MRSAVAVLLSYEDTAKRLRGSSKICKSGQASLELIVLNLRLIAVNYISERQLTISLVFNNDHRRINNTSQQEMRNIR